MSPEIPSKFTVYNLRSYFAGQPGGIRCCPACGGELLRSDIKPSRQVAGDLLLDGAIPRHDFSHLYQCAACQWWAIRESWSFCEGMQDMDFLIVGRATAQSIVPQDIDPVVMPWSSALENEHIYDHALSLPDALGKLFIGGKSKR